MGKVKDLLWELKDFDQVILDDPARDYHEAIASLKAIVSTHLDSEQDADAYLVWRIKEMLKLLERRL